jgi:hypothetical protein
MQPRSLTHEFTVLIAKQKDLPRGAIAEFW